MNNTITFDIKTSEKNRVTTNDYYIGDFTKYNDIKIDINIWNNRYGSEDVSDISNPKLVLYFDKNENGYLFNNLKVSIDYDEYKKYTPNYNNLIIPINRVIYGNKNSGSENNPEDCNNFINIKLLFENLPNGIEDGIKNLIIELQNN